MSRIRFLRYTAPLLALALAAACGGTTQDDADDAGPADEGASADPNADFQTGLSIAMLPKSVNNPYFDASSNGAEAAATALEGTFEYTGPSDASASSQVSYIDTLSQQATDVILLSANDPNALCSSLDQARAGGSVVVTFDSDVDAVCRDLFVSQVDSAEVGLALLEMTAEQIGGDGEVAILSATANATNQNAWIDVIESELESNPSYADIELVDVVYGDDEDEKSYTTSTSSMSA